MQYLPGQLAQLEVDDEANRRRQAQAQALQQAGFNPVQGGNQWMSLLASVLSTVKGGQMMSESDAKASEILAKKFEFQAQQEQAKAEAEAARRKDDRSFELQKIDYGNESEARNRAPEKVPFEQQLFNMLPENLRGQAALGKFGLGPKAGPGPSESDRKIAQLRELGATDDQIRGMLLGGGGQQKNSLADTQGAQALGGQLKEALAKAEAGKPLAEDAIRFVSMTTGIPEATLAKMKPKEVADAFRDKSTPLSNPILGAVPFVESKTTGPISESAAAKLAKINNPTGVVSNSDVQAARKSVFGLSQSDDVNARLIESFLSGPEQYSQQAQDLRSQLESQYGNGGQAPYAQPQSAAQQEYPDGTVIQNDAGQTFIMQNGKWMPN